MGPYERLKALAQKGEWLAGEVRLKKGSFWGRWGRILCEGCNKKRILHRLMVCNQCGLIYCGKCCRTDKYGFSGECPNCGGSGPPIEIWAEDFEKSRSS